MTYYSHFNGNTTILLYWIHSSTVHLSHLAGESHNSSILILKWEPVMVSPSNTNLTHFIKSNSRDAAFPVHSMKTYKSRGMASLSFNFGTRWRWMVSFTPVPLYLCGRTHIPIELEVGGPQSHSGHFSENYFSCQYSNSWLPSPLPSQLHHPSS